MCEDWSGITAEKLAELFPIILVNHNPIWKSYYFSEKEYLQTVFGNRIIRINHIGSTSVTGLLAKPIIDILLEVLEDTDLEAITEILQNEGYVVNYAKDDIITYIKGYTPHGYEGQAFHIHVRHSGDWGELYFRDYLSLHTDTAREYETLKKELQQHYTHDRDGYTEAKGQFVRRVTDKARTKFSNRYNPRS